MLKGRQTTNFTKRVIGKKIWYMAERKRKTLSGALSCRNKQYYFLVQSELGSLHSGFRFNSCSVKKFNVLIRIF